MIRKAHASDLEEIVEIYNQAIASKYQTADIELIQVKDRLDWFEAHQSDQYPIYVYELNDQLVGWISLSSYRNERKALRFTAEVSYYIHKDFQGKGLGSELMAFIINEAKSLNFKTLFAILIDRNEASINLLEKFRFNEWGRLPSALDFDGDECDHLYYGLRINE